MKRLLLLLFIVLIGCATARTNDEGGVRAAMNGFMDALNALDADRITASFTEDATAFFPLAQPQRAENRSEIDAVFRKFVETTKKDTQRLNLVPEDMRIETSGDLAMVSFQIRGASTARRTFIFRRVNGRWLIKHMHASNFKA